MTLPRNGAGRDGQPAARLAKRRCAAFSRRGARKHPGRPGGFLSKRIFAGVLSALLLQAAYAQDAPPAVTSAVTPMGTTATAPALEVKPEHRGYAADQPDIFIRQRLFGRAHGLSLLTAACLDLPAYSTAVQDAYAAWYAKQAKTLETIVHDLAAHYFGPRADQAQWSDLAHALNLPDSIQPALGEVTLHAACASLPEAIPRPRYELDKLLAGIADGEILSNDVAAAGGPRSGIPGAQSAPAPTIQKPAE